MIRGSLELMIVGKNNNALVRALDEWLKEENTSGNISVQLRIVDDQKIKGQVLQYDSEPLGGGMKKLSGEKGIV